MTSSANKDLTPHTTMTTVTSGRDSEAAVTSGQSSNILQGTPQVRQEAKGQSDNRDTLLALKNQVTFAKQCLGLLQNQMKHAMDTLNILKDQVHKAESTINRLEGHAQEPLTPNMNSVVSAANEYHELHSGQLPPGAVPTQRMIVVDGSGQALYAVDKPMHHHVHGSPCPCPSCTAVPPPLGHHIVMDAEQTGQLVAIHPSQQLYQYQDPPTSHTKQPSKYMAGTHEEQHHSNCESELSSVQASSRAPEPQEGGSQSQHGMVVIDSAVNFKAKKSSKSSSPIATQLLQVIDVLQNADDCDEDDERGPSTQYPTVAMTSHVHGSSQPFTGPIPYPVYSPSPGRHCRRSRKQDMSPIKKEDFRHTDNNTPISAYHMCAPEPEVPGMMRVPPPVLASTLEPEFLVVPGSSYFWESPTSGGDEAAETDNSCKAHSDETASLIKLEKDCYQLRSCSVSSQSQASDIGSSRSSSASSACEKTAVRCVDTAGVTCMPSTEHHEVNVVFGANVGSNVGANVGPTITSVCSIAAATSNVVTDSIITREPTTPSKSSPLNSAFPLESGSVPHEIALHPAVTCGSAPHEIALHPVVSRVTRAQKASPLNTKVTNAANERSLAHVTRSAALRTTHASPLNSLIVSNRSESPENMTRLSSSSVTSAQSTSEVPSYSVAQLSRPATCSSPTTKKPNILNRNRHGKKEIPEGIVVLVPTIEDAKKLIQSTGSNKDTPVLVPQHILDKLNGEKKDAAMATDGNKLGGKRQHPSQHPLQPSYEPPTKRMNSSAVVID